MNNDNNDDDDNNDDNGDDDMKGKWIEITNEKQVSPQSLAQTFAMMTNEEGAEEYKAMLPVAGESGSLKYRFVNTTAQGIVHAKTGLSANMRSLVNSK